MSIRVSEPFPSVSARSSMTCTESGSMIIRPGMGAVCEERRRNSLPDGLRYVLVFDDDSLPDGWDSFMKVNVSSQQEVIFYYALLGDSCQLVVSPRYARQRGRKLEPLYGLNRAALRLQLETCDSDTLAGLLARIPLDLEGAISSSLAVYDDDLPAGHLDPKLVHKKDPRNVLLSLPWIEGRMAYFNLLDSTGEFRFDHDSDHLQGMLVLEAMRQAGIAVTHLTGRLPESGTMALRRYCTDFVSYIEKNAPVIIRAYSSYAHAEGVDEQESYAVCQVFQWGKLCAQARLNAVVFSDIEKYVDKRIRTERVLSRGRRQYLAKLDGIKSQGGEENG
ncbi:MAG: AfsA-related hotdog domain-containing protein [Prosthecochloris sp.]|nr:AfsA-related hotdog domain-containing protein [Prosthecochloris sp.]